MQLISMFLIIVNVIHITRARNLLDITLERSVLNRDISKLSKPPLYIVTKKGSIGLFPSLPSRGNKFIDNLKPPKDNYNKTINPEQYKKPLMRKLSIKYINHISNKVSEVTTRRSLMKRNKYTVRPHDVYAESVRENQNWKSSRKVISHYSKIHKSERNIAKIYSKPSQDEVRLRNIKYVGNHYNRSIKLKNQNNDITTKLQALSLFSKYFKVNPGKEHLEINKLNSESKIPNNVVNNNKNGIIEKQENTTHIPYIFVKSDSKEQTDKIENVSVKVKKDQDENIFVRCINETSFIEPNDSDVEKTFGSDVQYLDPRPKRSVNIIEEESVATTYSGIKITNQEYHISHDFTFKNIHT